jgi:hypothetical protein
MGEDQTFRLEEYRALRQELELYLTESRSQERYTLIAVGVIWGWLVTNRLNGRLLSAIPIMLTVAASIRMVAILRHFHHIGEYIWTLENDFKVEGWEHKEKGWTLGMAYLLLSIVLIALTIIGYHYRADLTHLPCPVCPKT